MSVASEHSGSWTVEEVLALPEDHGQRVELVGGALMMSPAPGLPHQRASHRLHVLLERAAEAADAPVEIFDAINVSLPNGLLIPDLAVVDTAAAEEDGVVVSAHDVLAVAEIASPSTSLVDRQFKPGLYAAAGIAYYWRVELRPAPRIICLELHEGRYTERATALAGARTEIPAPFPLTVDPGRLAR